MYKVNVITFGEEDNYILPCGFNTEYSRTILLAFRGYNKGHNQMTNPLTIKKINSITRNHFDSVFEVQQDVLTELTKISAKIEARKFIERE